MEDCKSQEQLREEWHEFFIQNKNRFTDDRLAARADKNKIYIKKEIDPMKQHGDRAVASDIQYEGLNKFTK